MALQVTSIAGPIYARPGLAGGGSSRPLCASGLPAGLGSIVREGLSRPTVAATYDGPSFCREGATRLLSLGYLIKLPEPPPPEPDLTPPFVGNFDPPAGTAILKTTPISFDVTEDSGEFGRIFVVAFYPATGISELIHDGDGFRGYYAATSSRQAIAGGFRYTVLRSRGWPSAPTIQTFAVDRAGNEAS